MNERQAEHVILVIPLVRSAVLYTYTSTGYLQQLSNAVYPSQVFWTANSEDAFGQITQETYGNGVASTIAHNDPLGRITGIQSGGLQNLSYGWDALGNLTSRSDTVHGTSEAFQYDILNRLTQAQVTNGSGVQPAIAYSYDALGDIISKSDTGTYTYGGGAGPHAVTSISGPAGGSYGYDPDGNMTNRNGTVITWNSDNLPISITQSSSNSSSFSYAPDKHRYYQSAVINGVSETTVYAGAFEAVTTGGTTKYRYHLSADSREVAEVDLSNSGSTVNETISYVLSDHLGSVDVIQSVNQATGAITTTGMSFSAWGGRREANTWLPPVGSSETQTDHNADRYGFTHQEMLDNVGIIHMNGRIYDPNLGRFLSVDPVFEFPTNAQSLNPYSYVLNNPLSMTDPTGYVVTCGTNDTNCETAVSKLQPGQTTTQKVSVTPTGSHITSHATVTIGLTKGGNIAITLASGNGAKLTQQVMEQGDKLATTSEKGSFTFRPNVKIAPVELHKGTEGDLTNTMMQLYGAKGEVTSQYKPEWGDETVSKIAAQVCGETCGETGTKDENYPLQAGRGQIAHVRLNGIRKWGSFDNVQLHAKLTSPKWTGSGYADSLSATENAVSEDLRGIDPTFGSRWYNMRTTEEVERGSKFLKTYPFRTVYGPYSSTIHPYIVTYGPPP